MRSSADRKQKSSPLEPAALTQGVGTQRARLTPGPQARGGLAPAKGCCWCPNPLVAPRPDGGLATLCAFCRAFLEASGAFVRVTPRRFNRPPPTAAQKQRFAGPRRGRKWAALPRRRA